MQDKQTEKPVYKEIILGVAEESTDTLESPDAADSVDSTGTFLKVVVSIFMSLLLIAGSYVAFVAIDEQARQSHEHTTRHP